MCRLCSWGGWDILYYFYLFALRSVLIFVQYYWKLLEYWVSSVPPEFNFVQYIWMSIVSLEHQLIFMPGADLKFLY